MQVSKLRKIDGKTLQFVGIRLEKNMSQPRGTGRHLNIYILNDHSHPRKRSQRTQQCSCSCPYGLFISSSHRMKDVSQLCLYLLFDITQMTPECLRYVLLQFVWTITCHCLIGQGEWLNNHHSPCLARLSLSFTQGLSVSDIMVIYCS